MRNTIEAKKKKKKIDILSALGYYKSQPGWLACARTIGRKRKKKLALLDRIGTATNKRKGQEPDQKRRWATGETDLVSIAIVGKRTRPFSNKQQQPQTSIEGYRNIFYFYLEKSKGMKIMDESVTVSFLCPLLIRLAFSLFPPCPSMRSPKNGPPCIAG